MLPSSLTPSERAQVSGFLAARRVRLRALEVLAGDVSSRRYCRLWLAEPETAILALYPEELRPACRRFLLAGELLRKAGVRVPAVLASDCGAGWMLLEDVGEATLYDWKERPWSELAPFYRDALAQISKIAAIPLEDLAALGSPPLSLGLLHRELQRTWDAFLHPHELAGTGALRRKLERMLAVLCERLAGDPRVACHRDFMPRNLVPVAGRPAVIVLDHQDLRPGPPLYDPASLLNDSLFPSSELEDELLAGILATAADRLAYHRAAAQRTLKAVGTFAAFAGRGDERHLPLIAPTLSRSLAHLGHLPEAADVVADLAGLWRPVLRRTDP